MENRNDSVVVKANIISKDKRSEKISLVVVDAIFELS